MRLSFIIPTLGRSSLAMPLVHLCMFTEPGDQVLVAIDQDSADRNLAHLIVKDLCPNLKCEWEAWDTPGGCYGNRGRDSAIKYARGDRLVFMDDDDTWLPGAIPTIRQACREHPNQPLMFRMVYPHGGYLWRVPALEEANVGTPMFVPINTPGLPAWADDCTYTSDFNWISQVCAQQGEPVWREEIVARVDALQWQG